jgi:oligoribonuclease NrnB/cAMP/cGMP phosphodiesterase (DHH superfamily)
VSDLVLYHANCLDGFTAAWCAWLSFGDSAEYVPVQYGPGQELPNVTGRDVLIVDFSYPRDVLLEMHAKAKSLRVFDHHHTAQQALDGLDFCTFDMNRSGAGITYDELFEDERPPLVDYVEDRDLWRFKLAASKEINAYIGSFDQTFRRWSDISCILRVESERAVIGGSAILRATDRYVQEMTKQSFVGRLGDHDVPCVNAPYINTSELVGHLADRVPALFAFGWFQRGDGLYQYSLRSRGPFDVSAVAKQFGGGGHKQAAGFTVSERVHQEVRQ